MVNILDVTGFEWDDENETKNLSKHKITKKKIEEVFSNAPLFIAHCKNVKGEERVMALGKSNDEMLLTLIYTIRKNKIRLISARPQSKNERRIYNEKSEAED